MLCRKLWETPSFRHSSTLGSQPLPASFSPPLRSPPLPSACRPSAGLSSTPLCGGPNSPSVYSSNLPSSRGSAHPSFRLSICWTTGRPRPQALPRAPDTARACARQPASQPASQRLAHPSEASRLATVPEAQPGLAAWSPAHARLEDRLQLHQPEGRQEGRAATVRGGLPELVVWTPPLRSQPNRSSLPQRGSFFPCWIPTAIKETQAEILTAHARVEGLAHQSTSPPGAHKAGSLKVGSVREAEAWVLVFWEEAGFSLEPWSHLLLFLPSLWSGVSHQANWSPVSV